MDRLDLLVGVARGQVLLLPVYLASPIDLVPDILPVIGYVDDLLIVAWARWLIRAAPSALRRQWTGTGLRFMERLAGMFGPAAKTP